MKYAIIGAGEIGTALARSRLCTIFSEADMVSDSFGCQVDKDGLSLFFSEVDFLKPGSPARIYGRHRHSFAAIQSWL